MIGAISLIESDTNKGLIGDAKYCIEIIGQNVVLLTIREYESGHLSQLNEWLAMVMQDGDHDYYLIIDLKSLNVCLSYEDCLALTYWRMNSKWKRVGTCFVVPRESLSFWFYRELLLRDVEPRDSVMRADTVKLALEWINGKQDAIYRR